MALGSKASLSGRIGLCAALVCGLVAAGGSAAGAECETVWVDAYEVELEPRRGVYRVGETAVIDAVVTRKDTGAPVAGASLVAYLPPTRKGIVFGGGRTDDDGHAVARLKLKKSYVAPGAVELVGRGYQETADAASCARVVEFGEERVPDAFVIKR